MQRRARRCRSRSTSSQTTAPGTDLRLTLDVAAPGPRRAGAGRGGAHLRAQGRDRDRDGPAQRRRPGDGELAAHRREQGRGRARRGRALNRAVGFTYEPGSTFKSFTVAGALSENVVRPDTRFSIGPQIQVADRVIKEAHGTGGDLHRVRTSSRARRTSARCAIGQRLGETRFDRWVRKFGFGQMTGLPLPGESQGIVPKVKDYSGVLDREPADRPGPRRHADADGRRLRGDRQRRQVREAAARHRRTRRRAGHGA